MINEKIRAKLPKGAVIFENYSYDNSIIGVSFDGRAIYCIDKMIEELMFEEGMDYEEAAEWIDYNTLRAAPYFGDKSPLLVRIEL